MVTVINFGVGLVAGLIAWAVGLPNPLAWGVLGFVLNYIPYVGALMMEIGMLMVGLVTFPSLTYALIAPLGFLAWGLWRGISSRRACSAAAYAQSAHCVSVAGVLGLAVGTGRGVSRGAAPDHGLVVVVHLFPWRSPNCRIKRASRLRC